MRLGGCCIPKLTVVVWSFLGPDYWVGDFGDGIFMTGCFARTSIAWWAGGRKEVRRSEVGRMLHSKVDGCCMELFGTRLLGREFWGRVFYDGLLCTDFN